MFSFFELLQLFINFDSSSITRHRLNICCNDTKFHKEYVQGLLLLVLQDFLLRIRPLLLFFHQSVPDPTNKIHGHQLYHIKVVD